MASLKVVLPKGWTKLPVGKGGSPAELLSAMGIASDDKVLWAELLDAAGAVRHGAEVGRACLAASFSQVIDEIPVGAGLMVAIFDGLRLDLLERELIWRADPAWTVEGRVSLGCGVGLLRQRVATVDDYSLGNAEVFSAQMFVAPFDEGASPMIVNFSSPNVDLRVVLLRLFVAICSSMRMSGD